MFLKTKLTNPLQIVCESLLYFQVIGKSYSDPDDVFEDGSACHGLVDTILFCARLIHSWLRVIPDIVVCISDIYENNSGIVDDFTKYLKKSSR